MMFALFTLTCRRVPLSDFRWSPTCRSHTAEISLTGSADIPLRFPFGEATPYARARRRFADAAPHGARRFPTHPLPERGAA